MSRFAIRTPYFIIVVALVIAIVGGTALFRMPVDMFPSINIPMVVVATFYNGMPPEQIETDITGRFERFFTLGAGIDHMESRSLPGVSIINIVRPSIIGDCSIIPTSASSSAIFFRSPRAISG